MAEDGFTGLVLAGTRPGGDPLALAEGKTNKALIEVGGQPMLTRVMQALRDGGANRIAVSTDDGEVAALASEQGAEVLPTGQGPSSSAAIAFEKLGAPMVLTTSDHALLQGEWVRQLVGDTPSDADIGIMLARREAIEAALPGSRRTYLRFTDGQWSGCNLFYLRTSQARAAIDSWQAVEADRKRPWRIARRLGLPTLISYALGKLTLDEGISRLGDRMGLRARLIAAKDGRAAIDADKPGDLADIRALLFSEN